ncbi:MAG: sugar phosphate isomerase/epimerase [Bacteroidota bacterium]
MLQLGFVTAILPELSLAEVLEFAAQTGYDCVEVMCWPAGKAERRYAGVTHIDVANFSGQDAQEVQKLVDQYGVQISGLGYYPNPLCPDEEEAKVYVEHIRKVIYAAHLLGINQMNTFIGKDWRKTVEDNWPRFMQTWPPIFQYAEELGVKVAIENCPMYFTNDEYPGGKNLATTPTIWRKMFADIPSDYFGLNYDPSHMIWQMMDYLKPMREFTDKLFHIHAKDVRLDRYRLDEVGILATPAKFHTPKLPGMGDVDWSKFLSVLTEVGYRGPVCVEVEDRAYEGSLADRKASLIQSHTYLRQFIPKA